MTTFTSYTNINLSSLPTQPTSIRVKLRDAAGLESPKLTAAKTTVPMVASAGACDPAGISNTCQVATELCKPATPGAATGTCTPGGPPVLTSARAYRLANGDRRVVVDGSDPEGDISSVVLTFLDAANAVVMVDADGSGSTETPSILGFSYRAGTTSLHGRTDIGAGFFAATPQSTVTQVKVKLRDALGLDSGELTVPISALPIVASACDPRRSDNLCTAPDVCESDMSCATPAASRSAACAAAQSLTLGTAVTGTVPFGADRWQAPATCVGTSSSAGSEVVYKLTTSAVMDLHYTTDFAETTIDSVVYSSSACGDTLVFASCSDDVGSGDLHSDGYLLDAPAGDHYFFVDSVVAGRNDGGQGPYKLQVSQRPVLAASAACDPFEVHGPLRLRYDLQAQRDLLRLQLQVVSPRPTSV